jgi:hypothetical protein
MYITDMEDLAHTGALAAHSVERSDGCGGNAGIAASHRLRE